MDLLKKLEKIGLSEKEARVYNALLESGETTAQELTTRSGVNRATVYIVLENLIKRGLINRWNRQKKILFSLESPRQILDLLEKQRDDVEIKIKLAREVLPELEMLEKITGEKANVRFFEGEEGLKMIRKDMLKSKPKSMQEIFNINEALKSFPVSPKDHRQVFMKKKYPSKVIIIYDPKVKLPYLPPFRNSEYRYLPQGKLFFNAEFLTYNDKAILLSGKGKTMGVIIENKSIVDGLRFLFDLAWEGAEKYLTISTKLKKP